MHMQKYFSFLEIKVHGVFICGYRSYVTDHVQQDFSALKKMLWAEGVSFSVTLEKSQLYAPCSDFQKIKSPG